MEEQSALNAFAALSHPSRLSVFRVLLEAGPDGLPAGAIAQNLGIAPNALSFHLAQLLDAGLLTNQRNGRRIVYSADFMGMQTLISFLTENCCQRSTKKCSPGCASKSPPTHKVKKQRRQTPQPARL